MTIDSHHHFWNYSPEAYPWIGEKMDVLKQDYGPDDLQPLLKAAGVDGVVSVQARIGEAENDFLLGYAEAKPDFIKGVVGWIDLTAGEASVSETLARYSGRPLLKAIRHPLQGEKDDAYMLRDDFNRGLSRLHDFGLAYDILIYHRHLPNSVKLVDQHPDLTFIVDHIAKPEIRPSASPPDSAWVKHMKELGRREHVFCKLSGMVTEIRDPDSGAVGWTADLLRPYFEIALEAFGPDRLMFGSDWPVCLLRTSYQRWIETVRGFISGLSDGEQVQIMGQTAVRAYGLA